MNTVTYSDERVPDYLNGNFIPVRHHCDFDNPTDEMRRYGVKWTPTLLVLGADGAEHHRWVGFLPPGEFVAQLSLARAKLDFDRDRLIPAINEFSETLAGCPQCLAAPEARYFLGVSKFKQTHDAQELKRIWEDLSSRFPQSEWTRKAEPYSEG